MEPSSATVSGTVDENSAPARRAGLARSHRLGLLTVLFVVALMAAVAICPGPLRSAVQIGGDEFFEVSKGLLWANGYPPYGKVWNDQPALHTALLALAFKAFGPTIAVARAVAVGFGVSLLLAFFVLVKKRCGAIGAGVGLAFLLTAPMVLWLGASVMLEVPAIGTALWALWPVERWKDERRSGWLAFSGLLLAAAMQMKATAAVMGPALAVEVLLASQGASWRSRTAEAFRNLLVWGGSFAAFYFLLGLGLGENYDRLWASHFSSQMMDELNEVDAHGFSFRLLVDHTEALWGLGAGLFVVAARRDWRRLAFPLVMLLTVTAIHVHHRPWWPYYYLHFAVPLAWLAGYAVAELLRAPEADADKLLGRSGSLFAALCLLGLVVFFGGTRLWSVLDNIQHLPRVEDSALVAKMRQFAPSTKWAFTRGTIYPFHARLLVIPELAVIPAKRLWSGRITEDQMLIILEQYQPEQLLLEKARNPPEWKEFLDTGYSRVYEDDQFDLYVSKKLTEKGIR